MCSQHCKQHCCHEQLRYLWDVGSSILIHFLVMLATPIPMPLFQPDIFKSRCFVGFKTTKANQELHPNTWVHSMGRSIYQNPSDPKDPHIARQPGWKKPLWKSANDVAALENLRRGCIAFAKWFLYHIQLKKACPTNDLPILKTYYPIWIWKGVTQFVFTSCNFFRLGEIVYVKSTNKS